MLNVFHWLILFSIPVFVSIWASAVILGKVGYTPWLALLALIPGAIFVGMIILAFSTWPLERAVAAQQSD